MTISASNHAMERTPKAFGVADLVLVRPMNRVVVFLFVTIFACHLMAESPPVLKITVSRSGEITADGTPTNVDALVLLLRDLAAKKGAVWYYREAPEAEPHPNALKVLNAIVDQKLPVRLCAKPDFSDAIEDKGRSVPHP